METNQKFIGTNEESVNKNTPDVKYIINKWSEFYILEGLDSSWERHCAMWMENQLAAINTWDDCNVTAQYKRLSIPVIRRLAEKICALDEIITINVPFYKDAGNFSRRLLEGCPIQHMSVQDIPYSLDKEEVRTGELTSQISHNLYENIFHNFKYNKPSKNNILSIKVITDKPQVVDIVDQITEFYDRQNLPRPEWIILPSILEYQVQDMLLLFYDEINGSKVYTSSRHSTSAYCGSKKSLIWEPVVLFGAFTPLMIDEDLIPYQKIITFEKFSHDENSCCDIFTFEIQKDE